MIVFLHVVIALTSIALATYAYVSPAISTLRASYGFVIMTLLSGCYLVYTAPGHMIQACMSGVVYLSVVTMITAIARRRLLVMNQQTNQN
jgi:hypothetical protein